MPVAGQAFGDGVDALSGEELREDPLNGRRGVRVGHEHVQSLPIAALPGVAQAGLMLWLRWKTLSGSYWAFTAASRL
jgi:hypothetical protein